MQFVSSDTSVWIDFSTIHRLSLPFQLPYTYIMSRDAVEDELLSPPDIGEKLKAYGLVPVDITIEEFFLAQQYGNLYARLSVYDRIALAIARHLQIILMTGDGALRKAASKEGVAVIGTLGILDRLHTDGVIDDGEYKSCLEDLKNNNGGVIRLPQIEIDRRLRSLKQ